MPMLHKTTDQAAQALGTTRINLNVYLYRHPELKPATQLPSGELLWTDEEIESVREARANRRRPISRK